MHRTAPRRLLMVLSLVLAGLGTSGCWDASPEKINSWIDADQAEKALEEVTSQLADEPENPVLNLLAAKAQLAVCAQNNCTAAVSGTAPLAGVLEHFAKAPNPVVLDESEPNIKISAAMVVSSVLPGFVKMPGQPAPVLALLDAVPPATRPLVINALYQPALVQARMGNYTQASQYLTQLAANQQLGKAANRFSLAMGALFSNRADMAESYIIELRSLEGSIPGGAMALMPWALMAQAGYQQQTGYEKALLDDLPTQLEKWKINNLMNENSRIGLAEELNTIRTTPNLLAQWQKGWPQGGLSLPLTLQRLSLNLNPGQPSVWAAYLPAFIQAVSGTQAGMLDGLAMSTISATTMNVAEQQKLVTQLLATARTLADKPMAATPLVTFAGSFSTTKAQEVELEKLVQDLLIKANEHSDVTSTLALAAFRPEVAQNNRQIVLPLLVADIRHSLQQGLFEKAVSSAKMLAVDLKMDIQLEPIVLEEFNTALKDMKISAELAADKPDLLLEDAADVALNLGPLFTFMSDYFKDKPEVITAQLNTLVASAQGTYGPATAMHRLRGLYPQGSDMTPEKQQTWINQALTEALINTTTLSGPQMAEISAQLAQSQPGLALAPLMETAIRKAESTADSRTIWQQATPEIRTLLTSTHPQYTAFMRAVDALEENHLNQAATAFAEITTPQWKEKAAPSILVFQKRLLELAGTYVPVSANPAVKTAAVVIEPAGLTGGALSQISVTFINRLGTYAESNPSTYTNTPTGLHRLSLNTSLDFDRGIIAITPQVLGALPQANGFGGLYGNVTQLAFGTLTQGGVLQLTVGNETIAYTRTTVEATQPLRPDGTYLIQSKLNTPLPGTDTILPAGALISFVTTEGLQEPLREWNIRNPVYALTGDLKHPASNAPIPFVGFFDPITLATQFEFSYPLPQSGQPVKAATRCQALAGPIVCGSHHLHSPRQQFATLVAGMQTRESLDQSAALRADVNTQAKAAALKSLEERGTLSTQAPSAPLAEEAPGTFTTSASGLLTPPSPTNLLPPPGLNISATIPLPPVSATVTSGSLPTGSGMVVVPEGAEISKTGIAPGVFIHRTNASPTQPVTPPPPPPAAPAPAAAEEEPAAGDMAETMAEDEEE